MFELEIEKRKTQINRKPAQAHLLTAHSSLPSPGPLASSPTRSHPQPSAHTPARPALQSRAGPASRAPHASRLPSATLSSAGPGPHRLRSPLRSPQPARAPCHLGPRRQRPRRSPTPRSSLTAWPGPRVRVAPFLAQRPRPARRDSRRAFLPGHAHLGLSRPINGIPGLSRTPSSTP